VFEIGNSLRDARVRQGLDLPELEAETKIRAKYLKALEEEQFELLPGDAYVKGFLRTYADRLGLDGQLYVDEFNSRFADVEEPVIASQPRSRSRSGRAESHAVLLALVGIVAVTVLVIAAWRFGSSDEGGPTEQLPTAPAPATGTESTPPASAAEPVVLIVTAARGPSHVEVHEGSALGELRWEGTLQKGKTQEFRGTELWLAVSKPRNLEFKLDGEPMEDPAVRGPAVLVASAGGLEAADAP
jgi:cytoskeletal protein RodZ